MEHIHRDISNPEGNSRLGYRPKTKKTENTSSNDCVNEQNEEMNRYINVIMYVIRKINDDQGIYTKKLQDISAKYLGKRDNDKSAAQAADEIKDLFRDLEQKFRQDQQITRLNQQITGLTRENDGLKGSVADWQDAFRNEKDKVRLLQKKNKILQQQLDAQQARITELEHWQEITTLLEKDVPVVCESSKVKLLNERNAIRRRIMKTWQYPDLQGSLIELLKIPPGTPNRSLARTALAFAYTSEYLDYPRRDSEGDPAGFMKKALEAVQKEKTKILANPSKVIFLPIRYRRRANIQAGMVPALESITASQRTFLEQSFAQAPFTRDEKDKWNRWQSQSHYKLRYTLTSLDLSFQGKIMRYLELMRLDKPENGNRFMCKITTGDEEEAYFLSIRGLAYPADITILKDPLYFLSGKQVELDWTGHHADLILHEYWMDKDVDWHVMKINRLQYQSIVHSMIEDYTNNVFRDLVVNQGREELFIVELGGGSGNLAELLLENIEKQHPNIPVKYILLDLSVPDIETAIERFQRRRPSRWNVRPLVKNIFDYENAEAALNEMEIPKADIILSSGGPFSPSVGGELEQTLKLASTCAGILADGAYFLIAGGTGVWLNGSHFIAKGLDVKNTYDIVNGKEIYVLQKSITK